jgi:transcription termination factor Rho
MRAFNDTADSEGGKTLSCGLETTTVHFIKKYFGAARCFEKGGSLSVLGALSTATGNPADEAMKTELLPLCNLEIKLSDRMAQRRTYPALDLSAMHIRGEETETVAYLRNEYVPRHGTEKLIGLLSESDSYEDFTKKIKC